MSNAERSDPFVAFRFEVRFADFPKAGFSEVSGLQLETEVHDYMEGGQNAFVHKFPGRTKQTVITLKRGIVDTSLWDWYWQISQGQIRRRTGTIVVKDPSGAQDVMEFEFQRAFPSKWIGPQLNASQNSVAVETLELAYEGLIRIR